MKVDNLMSIGYLVFGMSVVFLLLNLRRWIVVFFEWFIVFD